MSERYEKPLHVAKTDTYTVTVNSTWLGIETLTTVAVTTAGVTIGAVTKLDNVIQTELTGVTVGTHELEFSWITSGGRSDCTTVAIIVKDC